MTSWYTEEHTPQVRFSLKVKEQLFSEQSPFQQIDVWDTWEFGRLMTLDGLVMVTERDEFIYHDMMVHVPLAVNPAIRKVLVIGGGDGGTVRELMRYPQIQADMVEIDSMVCDVSRRFFPGLSACLDHPRVNLHYQDGVAYLKGRSQEYDLILIDSTDPVGPGEGLFTQDFYRDCHEALTEKGILINQNESPVYASFAQEAVRAYEKLQKIFPVTEVYQAQIPTYPSGYWLFGFASKGLHPVRDLKAADWNKLGLTTRYYNTELHRGAFALPSYVKTLLAGKASNQVQ